jgi:hypothetical protein
MIDFRYQDVIYRTSWKAFRTNLIILPNRRKLEVISWNANASPPIPTGFRDYYGRAFGGIARARLLYEVATTIVAPKK